MPRQLGSWLRGPAEFDPLTSYDFASRFVGANSGRLLVAPGSSHSWPQDDPDGFAELIMELTGA